MPPDLLRPPSGAGAEPTWVGLAGADLPVATATSWAVEARCGAVVTFTGTARDHAPGRPGVDLLSYEAYEAHAGPRLQAVAEEARKRWPALGRIALLHRVGSVAPTEVVVVVVAAAPHREEAFAAARFCIDTLKATVPIWKRERWDGGESWGLEAHHLTDVGAVS